MVWVAVGVFEGKLDASVLSAVVVVVALHLLQLAADTLDVEWMVLAVEGLV